jgi:hypothetical protein
MGYVSHAILDVSAWAASDSVPPCRWGMVQGAFQEFYASTYYPETPESIISFIGGILAAVSVIGHLRAWSSV